MRNCHVLNLGAGVQSTAVYLLARDGRLPCDVAIFADTGEEPAAVYRHLANLQSKSSCVFCPYRTNQSWRHLQESDEQGWRRAVEIDNALRADGSLVTRGMRQQLFLHRSCEPLERIDFRLLAPHTLDPMSVGECHGLCGV